MSTSKKNDFRSNNEYRTPTKHKLELLPTSPMGRRIDQIHVSKTSKIGGSQSRCLVLERSSDPLVLYSRFGRQVTSEVRSGKGVGG